MSRNHVRSHQEEGSALPLRGLRGASRDWIYAAPVAQNRDSKVIDLLAALQARGFAGDGRPGTPASLRHAPRDETAVFRIRIDL